MNNFLNKDTFCSYCGSKFSEQNLYPRICFLCNHETWLNPIPVSVTLIAIKDPDSDKMQALIQQRNINPHKNKWALHGGYLNAGEPWKLGAIRELYEELNIKIDPNDIELFNVLDAKANSNLLIFNYIKHPLLIKDIPFIPNEEVKDIKVIDAPVELAFDTHTEMLISFFKAFKKC